MCGKAVGTQDTSPPSPHLPLPRRRLPAPRFRGQGLSNLLWALSRQRARDQELLSLLAVEALYKLDELRPLGLATLVSAWVAAR